jgi:hypothetical protein
MQNIVLDNMREKNRANVSPSVRQHFESEHTSGEWNMKMLSIVFAIVFALASHSYCNETPSAMQIKFEVPKDWKMVDSTTYILQDFNKTFNFSKKELLSGRQPWRLQPANVAAACLWDFGISDGSIIDDFADRLAIIEDGKIYSLKTDQQTFTVHIKTEDKTPIAYKFEIKK